MNPLLIWLSLLLVATPPADPLAELLSRGPLAHCTVSMAVADATTGESLYERSADVPLAPASNMKLVTTAAAVMSLGAEFQFTTRLLASTAPDERGVISGDLIVVGSGDPCLRVDALAPEGIADPAGFLVDLLLSTGVQRIDGQLVLDDGLLDRQALHSDWLAEDLDHSYAAPVSALSIGGNCLSVSVDGSMDGVRPGSWLLSLSDGYSVRNELRWSSKADRANVMILRPDSGGVIRISGELSRGVGSRSYSVPVRDGALLFGRRMLAQLRARHVTVLGGLAREVGAAQRHAGAVELVRFETPLSLAVLLANKESDNSICDHLFKLLGAHGEGQGSFAGGATAVRRFLDESVGTGSQKLVLRDGSGLSASNRLTAQALVDLLVSMNGAPQAERAVFLASLPVAGRDGSLVRRLTDAPYRGAMRAKTGFIKGVSSLSGYLVARTGRVLAFSILANGLRPGDNAQIKAIQDDLCRQLIELW
jgi:D-alanyl-D-alanine carboxypeptidase/D-alanyl-D-alanine-endopeptidase (penicillin-binding protein 4)